MTVAAAIRLIKTVALAVLLLVISASESVAGQNFDLPEDYYRAGGAEQAHALWVKRVSSTEVIVYDLWVWRQAYSNDMVGTDYEVYAHVGSDLCRRDRRGRVGKCRRLTRARNYVLPEKAFEFDPALEGARVRFRARPHGVVDVTWKGRGDYGMHPFVSASYWGAGAHPMIGRYAPAHGVVFGKRLGRTVPREAGLLVAGGGYVCWLCFD